MIELRRFAPLWLVAVGPLAGQAPPLAELWRVAGTTLPVPAALSTGPGGLFWNPAAVVSAVAPHAVGVEVLQTPDVLALSGLVASLTFHVAGPVSVGALAGGMQVADLVRTTTSPVAQAGTIAIESQMLGLGVGWHAGSLNLGILTRLHASRLDARREGGVTTDVGLRWQASPGLTLAAATRFLSPDLTRNQSTELNLGAEIRAPLGHLWGSAAHGLLSVGTAWHAHDAAEIGGATTLALNERFRVSWGLARERAFDETAWRSTLGLWFRAGHYAIVIARADGLHELGATYRLGLALEGG